MMTSSNGKKIPRHWLFVRGTTGHQWIPLTKASEREALMFSLVCAWTNGWVNNRDAGDVRRHRCHYDVTAMHLDSLRILTNQNYHRLVHTARIRCHFDVVLEYQQHNSTHLGQVPHICVSKQTTIDGRQAIIWTNEGILLIRTVGTNFNEMFSEIDTFSFMKMHLKMPSSKWGQFCLGLNVLTSILDPQINLNATRNAYDTCKR